MFYSDFHFSSGCGYGMMPKTVVVWTLLCVSISYLSECKGGCGVCAAVRFDLDSRYRMV